jgi:hypothetical protein
VLKAQRHRESSIQRIRNYRRLSLHSRQYTFMLDSGMVQNASKARPAVRIAIEWSNTALQELSPSTVNNCWNHVKILILSRATAPRPEDTSSCWFMKEIGKLQPEDTSFDEFKEFQLELSNSGEVDHHLSNPTD